MQNRLRWIDATRGLALSLVVLFHSTIDAHAAGVSPHMSLVRLNAVLDGFRMPSLVMISGLLAAGVGAWKWTELVRRRLAPLAVVYVVWSVLGVAFVALMLRRGTVGGALERMALMLVRPDPSTWYLYALIVYLMLAKVMRRVPSVALIAVAGLVNLAIMGNWPAPFGVLSPLTWAYVGEHWIFFVAAERGARVYWKLSRSATPLLATASIGAFVLLGGALLWAGLVTNAVALLVLAAAGTAVSLVAMPVWGVGTPMAWARAVGKNSLGIYVAHGGIALVLAHLVVPHLAGFRGGGVLVPVGIATVTIVLSYWLTRALTRWAPVPFLRPWWDASARPRAVELLGASAQAE